MAEVLTVNPGLDQAMHDINSLVADLTRQPQRESFFSETRTIAIAPTIPEVPVPVDVPEAATGTTADHAFKLGEFIGMWFGIKEAVVYSRSGGIDNDVKALARRSQLIGDFTQTFGGKINPHKFGRDMRRAIAIMKEDPSKPVTPKAMYPLLRPLGISRG